VTIVAQAAALGSAPLTFELMSRPLRIELAGGVYHITVRGNERKLVYRDDGDRRSILATLDETRSRLRWARSSAGGIEVY
jgi:hypothetical protein